MWLWVFGLCAFVSPTPGAPYVIGAQQSHYAIRSENPNFRIPEYRNNGYRQQVRRTADGFDITVEVRNRQLSSMAPGRTVTGLPPQMAELERRLNRAASGRLTDQVSILIQWLRRNLDANEGAAAQDVMSVLRRGSADCVGLANTALLVLDAMGVRARYVTGIAFKRDDPVRLHLQGRVLHRWIEIDYEDVGWVFCDPGGKVNFVEATYLVLGVEAVHPLPEMLSTAVGAKVELVRMVDGFRIIGTDPDVDRRLRLRPNRINRSGLR